MRLTHTQRFRALRLASAVTLGATSTLAAEPASPPPPPAALPPAAPSPEPAPAASVVAPAPAPPAAPSPTASAAPPAPVPVPEPAAPPADIAPPPPEAAPSAPEEETFPAAWVRFDHDLGALQLLAGAVHMLSDTVGIATDMYVTSQFLGEFDMGPAIVVGAGLTLIPMLGLQVDWQNHRAAALVPQLYLTGGTDPIYMELWLQNYEYGVFDKTGSSSTGGGNYIYGRLFVDYKLGKYFAVGPEAEVKLALNSKSKVGDKSLTSLPVGLNIMLPNYGKGNNFFIFAGYETQDTPNDKKLAGRLTFVRNF